MKSDPQAVRKIRFDALWGRRVAEALDGCQRSEVAAAADDDGLGLKYWSICFPSNRSESARTSEPKVNNE